MAAKFFTGLPMDGPDPECVQGYGEVALESATATPTPSGDHSHGGPVRGQAPKPVPLTLMVRPPVSFCEESPLAGMR